MSKWQVGDDDLTPAYICGNCKHFQSADISAEDHYEDVGICNMRIRDTRFGPTEYAILWNDDPKFLGCEEWESI